MLPSLLLLLTLPRDPFVDAPGLAARVDALTAAHWQAQNVKPAPLADDLTFLRRVTLDLVGRVPTETEARSFAHDTTPDRRASAVRRLITSPEYALHMGRVLDQMIQGQLAGDADFLEYLRAAVADRKPWDVVFRDVLLGPWDTKEKKRADRFLSRRQNSLDDLTTDTARVFFGVNVSCAKCHDHPLVHDWTQDHYFGMASFFSRTAEAGKGTRNGDVGEKPAADVQFVTTRGERRTAKTMFLSGRVLEPLAADASRRERLVAVALEEKTFFSKAIANRLWAHLFGRGIVQPVDQMHSANPPSVPGLLEFLASDLAAHGYELDRTVAGLVLSTTYQRSGVRPAGEESSLDRHFAQATLRPLGPQPFALSLVVAAGDGSLDQAMTADARGKKYRELEGQAGALVRPGLLDGRTEKYQASAGEALFMSNHPDAQKVLTAPKGLVGRMSAAADAPAAVDLAVWAIFGRPPEAEEREHLVAWVAARKEERPKVYAQLVWALVTSAEFRFNH